jgi:hypothetical protein
MSLKKFGRSDLIRNAMRAYPHNNFLIYSSSVYYDRRPIESGSFNSDILSASGGISLFEYNVDREGAITFEEPDAEGIRIEGDFQKTGQNPPIIPYVIKSSTRQFLKASPRQYKITSPSGGGGRDLRTRTGNLEEISNDYLFVGYGSVLTGSTYPASASITRELMTTAGGKSHFNKLGESVVARPPGEQSGFSVPNHRHYYALRNSLDFYSTRSPHYGLTVSGVNKDEQDINLISVPKIFFGSRIKPGSMSLKFYVTGTLVGELQDTKYNGELIQVGPYGSTGSGSVAGVAMYEEGFVLLTGSWDITSGVSYDFTGVGVNDPSNFKTGSWLYFAAGANDGISTPTDSGETGAAVTPSASFDFSFKGHTETQVLTMFAHARRGEVNYSNNPTFLEYGQTKVQVSSSNLYIENDAMTIKNTVSSSYAGHSANFERQVYISKVALYDDDKKLIGIASLSSPVLKKETQDLSFKLKLDI